MGKQKSVKGATDSAPDDAVFNMDKFLGAGVMFKCKLFGSMKVDAPRGDAICAEAINKLKQQAKQLNKESKVHKQRIFLNISLKGIRIIDQKNKKLVHAHIVHKISYISHDKDDRRSFAYVVSLQDGYTLFAFRTEKNAGNVTASLKELFHVIYLKHKHQRENADKSTDPSESSPASNQEQDKEIEAGVEEKEEDPYAVPTKFQLVEKKEEEPSHYAVPNTRQEFQNHEGLLSNSPEVTDKMDNNLLDWTDVNEELEFMHKDMKRSDTKQLLAELGDLNMDANPPQLSERQSIFSDDPFFEASAFSSADQGGLKSSTSDPNLKQKSNPFLLVTDDRAMQPMSNLSINKSKSMDVGLFDSHDAFSPQQGNTSPAGNATLISQVGDLFSSVQPSQQQSVWASSHQDSPTSDWGALKTDISHNAFNANQQQMPTLTPVRNEDSLFGSLESETAPQLIPEKISEPKAGSDDPFAALAGGISNIRGMLPTAEGESMPQFPKKTKPTPTSPRNSPMTISQGPTMHPSQLQPQPLPLQQPMNQNALQRQTNPFHQGAMQYNPGFPSAAPQIPSRPDIPVRVDLMAQTSNFQGPLSMQQATGPSVPKPYMQTNGASFQTQGIPSMGGNDPFSGLGGAFSLDNTSTASEPLYATVDKSKKSNVNTGQANTDMFAMFDSKQSASTAGPGANMIGDAFGTSNMNTASAPSNQDPFGDLGSF